MPNIYQQQFWDDEDGELWDEIAETMLSIYLQGVDGGVAALPANIRVLTDWDGVNTAALEFAKQYRYTLIKGITDTTRTQTQKVVSDWIQSGAPLDALETALEGIYGPKRAERIAVTEVTRVFAEGNKDAWDSTGLVDRFIWNTARDELVCELCAPRDGMEFDLYDEEARPPIHVHDRCWMTPVVSDERLAERLDEILA